MARCAAPAAEGTTSVWEVPPVVAPSAPPSVLRPGLFSSSAGAPATSTVAATIAAGTGWAGVRARGDSSAAGSTASRNDTRGGRCGPVAVSAGATTWETLSTNVGPTTAADGWVTNRTTDKGGGIGARGGSETARAVACPAIAPTAAFFSASGATVVPSNSSATDVSDALRTAFTTGATLGVAVARGATSASRVAATSVDASVPGVTGARAPASVTAGVASLRAAATSAEASAPPAAGASRVATTSAEASAPGATGARASAFVTGGVGSLGSAATPIEASAPGATLTEASGPNATAASELASATGSTTTRATATSCATAASEAAVTVDAAVARAAVAMGKGASSGETLASGNSAISRCANASLGGASTTDKASVICAAAVTGTTPAIGEVAASDDTAASVAATSIGAAALSKPAAPGAALGATSTTLASTTMGWDPASGAFAFLVATTSGMPVTTVTAPSTAMVSAMGAPAKSGKATCAGASTTMGID